MPKIQGLWRPHAKIDEAEFESAKTRTAARLADLFGVDAPAATPTRRWPANCEAFTSPACSR